MCGNFQRKRLLRFFQFLASEVSELYRNKVLLKEENQKLQEMSVAIKELSKNVITLTREEEMLSMKMRVHDNLGYSVLAAQRMLMRESEADRDIFRSQWITSLWKANNCTGRCRKERRLWV